jgi:hypothetical protein
LRLARGSSQATFLLRYFRHSFENAAIFSFEHGQARKGGRQTEKLGITRMDSGDEGVGEIVRRLAAKPPSRELGDRFFRTIRSARPQSFGQQR